MDVLLIGERFVWGQSAAGDGSAGLERGIWDIALGYLVLEVGSQL